MIVEDDDEREGLEEEEKVKELVQVFTLGPLQAYGLAALYVPQWHPGGTLCRSL